MKRLLFTRSTFFAILTIGLCIFAYQFYGIYENVQTKLAQTRSRLKEQNIVTFERVDLTPHPQKFVEILQNTIETRDLAFYKDSYFAATGGGLLQLSSEGKLIKHYTVLDGLPESDLTTLTVFGAKLIIGTKTSGVLTFDGEKFTQFRFTNHETQAITTFEIDNGTLLIGTFAGGLLDFDGKTFREVKAENQSLKSITFIAKKDSELFVGTFNSGLWCYQNDIWKHLTIADGLPSNRIIGVVKNGNSLLVATDFGLSVLENSKFRTIKDLPMISSLESFDGRIYISTEDGELYTFDHELKEDIRTANIEKTRLIGLERRLFMLTDRGIFADHKLFADIAKDELTDNFVTAIAFDKSANIWVGTFRMGIDVFTAEGKKIKQIEDDNIREINYLQMQEDEIRAATSRGLWRFKADYSAENLAKNSITHFQDEAIATNQGLIVRGKLFSTVNGLPGNSIFSTLKVGNNLYVGTLGGLAEVIQNKVVRTWTDANSKLTNNWITALCFADSRIFIGTYGGGVLELLPSGELQDFTGEIGKVVVNPNAMFSDAERLYVGTLNGVKILDFQKNQWWTIKDILPAEAVFTVNQHDDETYFGTTNGIAKVNKSYFLNPANAPAQGGNIAENIGKNAAYNN